MIELLGLLYGIVKDIKQYISWKEEIKVVDEEWLEKSGFKEKMEIEEYKLYWSSHEKIESRLLDGYEIIYELDRLKRVRRRIEWTSGQDSLVLLGKKKYITRHNYLTNLVN